MGKKSIVLLSGGLDSVVNCQKAIGESNVEMILTFDYGQTASSREHEASQHIAEMNGILHHVIELDFLKELDNGLTKGNIPNYDAGQLDNLEYAQKTAKAVWVPNRNGIFINIAAAFADRFSLDEIVVGFNKEEGATFPDNTPEYLERASSALEYSTLQKTKVVCYTQDLDKKAIVKMGRELGAAFEWVWSCYFGGEKMCGECESCRRLKRALMENQYLDEFQRINHWGFR